MMIFVTLSTRYNLCSFVCFPCLHYITALYTLRFLCPIYLLFVCLPYLHYSYCTLYSCVLMSYLSIVCLYIYISHLIISIQLFVGTKSLRVPRECLQSILNSSKIHRNKALMLVQTPYFIKTVTYKRSFSPVAP
jgi:hypothetical protein